MAELLKNLIDLVLHLDKHLSVIIQNFGTWSYFLLFGIVFAETGLVVTPFLPGDSLLFAVGTFAAVKALDIWLCFCVLTAAAIIGDSVNYAIGKFIGPKVFHYQDSRIFKREYLVKTHNFYEKYGAKTIVIARFVPIVRTFAPFVAGVGQMSYRKFLLYNVLGGLLWVSSLLFAGYFLGNIPFVRKNFSIAILAIIFVSLIPGIIEFWKHHRNGALAAKARSSL